jgi:hypothetical protein
LTAAWFQPLSLSSENPVSNLSFHKCNVYRYNKVIDKNQDGLDKVLNTDQWDTAAGLVKSTRPA